ncbi:MAG: YvrJ family protein [Paraclostridium sp.]
MGLVANLDFPTIVTMYLLVRIEYTLESMIISINSLNSNISELNINDIASFTPLGSIE